MRLLLVPLLLALAAAVAQAQQQPQGYNFRETESLGLADRYPPALSYTPRLPVRVASIEPGVRAPTCLNPGFTVDLDAYLAEVAQLKTYVLGEIQSVVQAAPLLLVDSLFPELGAILKHLNNMTWLKLDLQRSNCQSFVDGVRPLLSSTRYTAYNNCVTKKLKADVKLETAESQCGPDLSKVTNFFTGVAVEKYNLIEETVAWARKQRDENHRSGFADDATLAVGKDLSGEITVTPDGNKRETKADAVAAYRKFRDDARKALERLIATCRNQLARVSRCRLQDADLNPVKPDLYLRWPDTEDPDPLFSLPAIYEIARLHDNDATPLLEELAHRIAMAKVRFARIALALTFKEALQIDGMKAHTDNFKRTTDNMDQQIAMLEQRHDIRRDAVQSSLVTAEMIRTALYNRAQIRDHTGAVTPRPPQPALGR